MYARKYLVPLINLLITSFNNTVFAVDALTLLVAYQEEYPSCKMWWGAGVFICLQRVTDGAADATATQSSVASLKSRMVKPFWCRLIRVVWKSDH